MTASATQVAETESPAEPPMHRRVWTLVAACFGLLLVLSSMVALNTALGDLAIETSATQTQLTWIVDAYTLVMACLLLPAGALGDRFGRRGALLFGLVVFAIASAAPILAPNPAMLIISRGLAGAGMLGSGVLLNFWSWPSIFWAFTISSVALIPLTLLARPSKESERHPLDTVGAVLIGAAVAIFVFGILEIPSRDSATRWSTAAWAPAWPWRSDSPRWNCVSVTRCSTCDGSPTPRSPPAPRPSPWCSSPSTASSSSTCSSSRSPWATAHWAPRWH
ncbi:MAG: MFS transporter [Mycobacterium sp.]|nr:MFS transporter [Mycobacterium sp.]